MKKIGLSVLLICATLLNAATITSRYKLDSNLEFKLLPKEQWITYEVLGKERLFQRVDKNSSNIATFEDEFSNVEEVKDPFESYNRVMTTFNDYFYTNILDPVARGYANVIPEDGRVAISNFFENITFPIRFVNNILQFKFYNAFEETQRFVINSTVGILGFFDPASEYKIKAHKEDFGQTLGYYGFEAGPHIVIPLLGPSNLRDITGLVADSYISPLTDVKENDIDYKIPERGEQTLAITSFNVINSVSLNLGQYENLKKDAIDLYPFLRDTYTQNREKEIKE